MTNYDAIIQQLGFIERGSTLYKDKRDIQVFEPPVPMYSASGQNNYTTWNDLVSMLGADAIQRSLTGQQKYINMQVHWYGKITGIDAQNNSVKIKMNPTLIPNPQSADIALIFERSTSVNPFEKYVGQSIDFVGKILKIQKNELQMQYLPFCIYDRPEIPKDLQEILQKNGHSADDLQNTVKTSPLWEQYLSEGYPFMIRKMFQAAQQLNVAITFEVVAVQGPLIKGKTNPQGASRFTGPDGFDILIQAGNGVNIPGSLKPGVLASGLGKLTAMDDHYIPTLTVNQIQVHDKPGQTLESIPVNVKKPIWDQKSMEIYQAIKVRGQQLHQFLAQLRGLSRASSVSSQSSATALPTVSIAKPVIKASVIKPNLVKGGKVESKEEISQEIPAESTSVENTPVNEDVEELHNDVVTEEKDGETTMENTVEEPDKPKPIYDENGRVKLDEERNEYMGKDVSDVAMELMKSAPKTAYTQQVSLDFMAEEDDVVQRIRAMKENGFLNEFNNKADDVLDQLTQFVQNSKQGIIGAGQQGVYNDNYGSYDTYGTNYNDYNNYGSYGGTYDYNQNNYGDYGSYNTNSYDQNNQYGDYNNNYNYGNYGGSDYNTYGSDYQNNGTNGNYGGW